MSNFKQKVGAFVKGEKLTSSVLTAIILGLVIVVNIIVFVLDSYFGWFLFKPAGVDMSISGATDGYFESAIAEGKKVEIAFCRAEDEIKNNNMTNRYGKQALIGQYFKGEALLEEVRDDILDGVPKYKIVAKLQKAPDDGGYSRAPKAYSRQYAATIYSTFIYSIPF